MASTVTAATLTVTLQESITLNNLERGSKNVLTVANINEVDNRVMSIPSDAEVTIVSLGTSVAGGQYIRSDMKYLRITNLDATNFVRVRVSDTGGVTADVKIEAGKSFMLGNGSLSAHATEGAFSAFVDIDTVKARADSLPVDVEIFIAST